MNDSDDRDTLPPPSLAAQLAEVRGALEQVSALMVSIAPKLDVLAQRLNVHELAILTAEHKIHRAFDLERRVERIENLITAAE